MTQLTFVVSVTVTSSLTIEFETVSFVLLSASIIGTSLSQVKNTSFSHELNPLPTVSFAHVTFHLYPSDG